MGRLWGGFVILALAAGAIHANGYSCAQAGWRPAIQGCREKNASDGSLETCAYECANTAANEGGTWLLKYSEHSDYLTIECPTTYTCFDFDVENLGLAQSVTKIVWKHCPLPMKKSLAGLFQQLGLLANLSSMSIENYDAKTKLLLEAKDFQGLATLRQLTWSTAHFEEESALALKDLESLEIRARHVELSHTFLPHLRNLRKFVISYEKSLSIDSRAFGQLNSLTDVSISFHGDIPTAAAEEQVAAAISSSSPGITLRGDVFHENSQLLTIRIDSLLYLESLPRNLLEKQRALKSFTLTRTFLAGIPDGFFKNSPFLTTIDMSHNRITQLAENTFVGLMYLESLNLNDNRIATIHQDALQNLPLLRVVDFSWNQLEFGSSGETSSPLAAMTSIVRLNLSHNHVTKIFQDWLNNMKGLEWLDISYNNLSRLRSSDVSFAQKQTITVNMQFNAITLIELDYHPSPVHYSSPVGALTIQLGNNPIECKRDSKALRDFVLFLKGQLFVSARKNIKIDPEETKCHNPNVPLVQFYNDCPSSCVCTEDVVKRIYEIDCSSRNLTEAPKELAVIGNGYHIILIIDNNLLTRLPSRTQKGYEAVIEIRARHNHITQVTLDNLLPNLRVLDVRENIDDGALFQVDCNVLTALKKFKYDATVAYGHISCTGSDYEHKDLTVALRQFLNQSTEVRTLEIESATSYGMSLEVINKGTNLVNVSVLGAEFHNIPANAFDSVTKLQVLIISFKQRRNESIEHAVETTLDENLFSHNKEMREISISNIPNLPTIPERIFVFLLHLRKITFNNNNIKVVPNKIFQNNSDITYIDLSGNQLTFISDVLFSGLSKLEVLIMRDNRVYNVHQLSFINLPNIQVVDFTNNLITFNGFIDKSPFWNNKQLTKLILSNNSISRIFSDWRVSLIALQHLDLSFNHLPEINYLDLEFRHKNDVSVDIRYNKIRHIRLIYAPPGAVEEKNMNVFIDVQNNPMECGCTESDLARYLRGELALKYRPEWSGIKIDAADLFCDSIENNNDNNQKKVSELRATDMGCPDLTKHCPDKCSCSLDQGAGRKLMVIDCSYLGLAQAPPKLTPYPSYDIVLILTGNLLTEPPLSSQPGYEFVVDLRLASNDIRHIRAENWLPGLKALDIRDNGITSLSSDLILMWFEHPVEKLDFDRSKITHIDLNSCEENGFKIPDPSRLQLFQKALEGMSRLEELHLTCAHIEMNNRFFAAIPNLRRFTLLENSVSIIQSGAFSELYNLTSLVLSFRTDVLSSSRSIFQPRLSLAKDLFLSNSRLQEITLTHIPDFGIIDRHILYSLNDLVKFNFSSNNAQSLPDQLFQHSHHLALLDLSHNQLTHISGLFLIGLENLKEIHLNDNLLESISPDAFKQLVNLEIVHLSHNQLSFASSADNLMFAGNPRVAKLLLSHNAISRIIHEWQQLPNLELLDLSFNRLTKLDNSDVRFALHEVRVNVQGNRISTLDFAYEDLKPVMVGNGAEVVKTSIALLNNPTVCDCGVVNLAAHLQGLKRIQGSNDIDFDEQSSLTCQQPGSEANTPIYEIDVEHTSCLQWDKIIVNCPEQCNSCYDKADDKTYVVNCTGRGLEEAPAAIKPPAGYSTVLFISYNHLRALPSIQQPGYETVAKLYASDNRINAIYLDNLAPNLAVLDVEGNPIANVDSSVIARLREIKVFGVNLTRPGVIYTTPITTPQPPRPDPVVPLIIDGNTVVIDFQQNQNVPPERHTQMVLDLFFEVKSSRLEFRVKYACIIITQSLFVSVPTMEKLELIDNQEAYIEPEALAQLPRLQVLILSFRNKKGPSGLVTETLPSSLFRRNELLAEISITDDPFLSAIASDVFLNLRLLRKLVISRTAVRSLPDHLFANAASLTYLDLSHNHLTDLSEHTLAGLTSLQELHLNNNLLRNVDSRAFSSLSNVISVQLSHNALSFELSFASCQQIKYLYVDYNHMSQMSHDWFYPSAQLDLLSLTNNNFKQINVEFFKLVGRHASVSLENNEIRFINVDDSPSLLKTRGEPKLSVQVGKNPIDCSCSNWEFIKYAQRTKYSSVVNLENAECQSPDNMKGMLLKNANPNCDDWIKVAVSECPSYCTCERNLARKIMRVDCSYKFRAQLPEKLFPAEGEKIELNLAGNRFKRLPIKGQPGYDSVVVLRASRNDIVTIRPNNLLPNLEVLELHENPIKTLPTEIASLLSSGSTRVKELTIGKGQGTRIR